MIWQSTDIGLDLAGKRTLTEHVMNTSPGLKLGVDAIDFSISLATSDPFGAMGSLGSIADTLASKYQLGLPPSVEKQWISTDPPKSSKPTKIIPKPLPQN